MEGRIKVITAFANQQLQDYLRQKMSDIEFIQEDQQYQEALLDLIKDGCQADALILNTSLDGLYDFRALIQSIRSIKKAINIVPLFKSTPDEDMQNWLESRNIHFVLIDNSFTIEDLYHLLKPERKLRVIESPRSDSGKTTPEFECTPNGESSCIPVPVGNEKTKMNTRNAYRDESQIAKMPPLKMGILSRLFHSIAQSRNPYTETSLNICRKKNTMTIALFGSHPGAGCTHTAISIAWFLSMQKGNKVALIELDGSGAFERLGKNIRHISEKSYEFNGLYLYYDTPITSLIKLKTYSHILIDCGCICARNEADEISLIRSDSKSPSISDRFSELERSDMKICVCQVKPWQADETIFLMNSDFMHKRDCLFYFTMTDNQAFKAIKKDFAGRNLFKAPYDPEIFTENQERDLIFQTMLSTAPGIVLSQPPKE